MSILLLTIIIFEKIVTSRNQFKLLSGAGVYGTGSK